MIGFAGRPGTEVEPMWSTVIARRPSATVMRWRSISKRCGQSAS
jgi:hypothetical protein